MNPSPSTTRVWLLEDHEPFARVLRNFLQKESDFVCEHHFSLPDDLLRKLASGAEPPDVLLLDIGLPQRSGLEVLVELRQMLPDLKILMLSSFDDRERVYRAICNGASGYLLKNSDPDEIVAGIRDVVQGAAALSGAVASMILQGFAKHGPVEPTEALSQREEEVLCFLVKGMIKKEIAEVMRISQHTVDMHLRGVYRKLHVRSQAEAVSKALRKGLV